MTSNIFPINIPLTGRTKSIAQKKPIDMCILTSRTIITNKKV